MTWLARTMIGIAGAAMAVAAPAQIGGTDGATFIEKVREGDTAAAIAILESKPGVIDSQDERGETALLVAVKKRDPAWTAPPDPGGRRHQPFFAQRRHAAARRRPLGLRRGRALAAVRPAPRSTAPTRWARRR